MKCLFYFLFYFSITFGQSKNGKENIIPKRENCEDTKTTLKRVMTSTLSDSIKETSGLVYFEGLFWTHNDDHDTTLYGLDASGKIKRKITLNGVVNHDWEAISQDSSYLYIGDFGNNYSGNRKDLSILKIDKTSFLQEQPHFETITFSYENQTDFSEQLPNKTELDCEAFVVIEDRIYLFTKQWQSAKTSMYVLPNATGHQVAQLQSTWNCKGLITDATYLAAKKTLVLCGYTKKGSPFLYLFDRYNDNDFFTGCKRRVALKLRFHQIEGITTIDGATFYLTNEALTKKPFLKIPQQWHVLEWVEN